MFLTLFVFFAFLGFILERYQIDDFPCLSLNELGDSFGILNTLFSAFAMAFAGYAIYYQGQELKEQKAELSLTRLEFETTRATNILYKQIELINKARVAFEEHNTVRIVHLGDFINKLEPETIEDEGIKTHTFSGGRVFIFPIILEINNAINLFREFEKVSLKKEGEKESSVNIQILSKILRYNIPYQYFNTGKSVKRNLEGIDSWYAKNKRMEANAHSSLNLFAKIGQFAIDYPHQDQ